MGTKTQPVQDERQVETLNNAGNQDIRSK